jgi:hypothetical protein
MRVMMIFAAFAAVVSVFAVRHSAQSALRPLDLLRIGGLMMLVVSAIVAIMWRRLAVNAIGRQLSIVGWMSIVAIVVHPFVAYLSDAPTHSILATDLLIFAAIIAARASRRRLVLPRDEARRRQLRGRTVTARRPPYTDLRAWPRSEGDLDRERSGHRRIRRCEYEEHHRGDGTGDGSR